MFLKFFYGVFFSIVWGVVGPPLPRKLFEKNGLRPTRVLLGWSWPAVPASRLFVANLSPKIPEPELRLLFGKYGSIRWMRMLRTGAALS